MSADAPAFKIEMMELGPMENFLKKIEKSEGEDETVESLLRSVICKILTEEGETALKTGELSGLIGGEKRAKYRNPPAHTRFLSLSVAKECKEYVDEIWHTRQENCCGAKRV